jgi:hypothetical protein
LVAEALRRRGAAEPGRHVAMVRDYLGFCLVVRREAFARGEVERLREALRTRQLTPVWFPGVRDDELNRPDVRPGPPGEIGDWEHHLTERLLGGEAEELVAGWAFDIRPTTDDRPFFRDFSRLGQLGRIRQAFGEGWWARAELTRLFVLAALLLAGVAAALGALLPLALVARGPGRGRLALYFGCLGLGFMALELAALSRVTRLVGDPVLAGSITIAIFLVFSGFGSRASSAVTRGAALVASVALVGPLGVGAVDQVAAPLAGAGLGTRALAAMALLAPAAFLMGFAMPLGLGRLEQQHVPWAWGVNGFASVVASPLTLFVAMHHGYSAALAGAAGLYLMAALLLARSERVPG